MQRRELLFGALPLSAAVLLEQNGRALAAPDETQSEAFDQETFNFWTSQAHQPSQAFAEHGRLVSSRGLELPNEAEFLFYSPENGFVRAASTTSDTSVSKTLLEKGDAGLLLSLDTVRPSADHLKNIWSQKNGSLRIDLKQAIPLQHLSETLNWSAIASLVPGDKPFSDYHEITFDPKSTWGQAKKVPLTGGVGFWAWNFCTQSKPSFWSEVMQMVAGKVDLTSLADKTKGGGKAKGIGAAILGIGLPAVAKTALGSFNDLFGSLLAKGSPKNEWIIHNADTPLLATQAARQEHPGHAVALRSGAYVITAADNTQVILSGKYELRDGVIVPAGTKDAGLDEAAKHTLPNVSYIAISTVVQPLT